MSKKSLARVDNLSHTNVVKLVTKYMAFTKARLVEIQNDEQIAVIDKTIVNLVLSCMESGSFQLISKFIEDASEKCEQVSMNNQMNEESRDIDDDFDIDALQKEVVKSVVVSTKLMANQAVSETKRISRLRSATEMIEERLFSPEMIKRMNDKNLTRVYQAASSNLNNSVNFIKGVNSNLVNQLETLNQVKKIQAEIEEKETHTENKTEALESVRSLILEKIKKKVVDEVDLF